MTSPLMDPNLSRKQMMFVSHYSVTWDAVKSAKEAGYKNPSAAANKLQQIPKIKAILASLQRDAAEELEVDRRQIIRETMLCAFRDVADLCDGEGYINVSDLRRIPERIRRTIDGVKVRQRLDRDGNVVGQECELKLVPKLASLELLAKIIGALEPEEQKKALESFWDPLYLEHHNGY